MRALKVLVIVMGVLLAGGIVALGFAVQYRINHPRQTPAAAGPAIGPAGAANVTTLDLPQGAKAVGAEASGDRLVIRVELASGGAELIIVNLATGAPIATVTLRPKAAP
ncbi:MAG TPA: hypothetical protein VG328_07535 [Stellaceae bacterium]|jgi:hypothetical protein|nr:hypothetical protein [Stellaceae bacterium]